MFKLQILALAISQLFATSGKADLLDIFRKKQLIAQQFEATSVQINGKNIQAHSKDTLVRNCSKSLTLARLKQLYTSDEKRNADLFCVQKGYERSSKYSVEKLLKSESLVDFAYEQFAETYPKESSRILISSEDNLTATCTISVPLYYSGSDGYGILYDTTTLSLPSAKFASITCVKWGVLATQIEEATSNNSDQSLDESSNASNAQ